MYYTGGRLAFFLQLAFIRHKCPLSRCLCISTFEVFFNCGLAKVIPLNEIVNVEFCTRFSFSKLALIARWRIENRST